MIGPSGAGKSSLVRAGLLPALSAGWLGGSSDWRIAELRPGERPFRRLSEALVSSGAVASDSPEEGTLPTIEAELRRGPLGLVHLVAEAHRSSPQGQGFKLLVLVDQFEEIFRYAQVGGPEADESEAFVNLLLASRAIADAGIYVALTMRTDFLGHCVRFLDLPDAINRAQYLTPRLTRTELEQAITGPALVFGGDVAPELVNELINSLDQDFDQLPLLQHALARMWATEAEAGDGPPTLKIESLKKLGGLQGALSAHAEEVFGQLSDVDQARAETLFRCITLREGTGAAARSTRSPERLEQIALVADCPWTDLERVVTAFAADGVSFLHHGTPLGPESVIDISHEALIRQWDRLQDWAEDEAKRATELRRWRDRAEMKQRGGELLTGADLARALEWLEPSAGQPQTPTWAARYLGPKPLVTFRNIADYIQDSLASKEAADNRIRVRARRARLSLIAVSLFFGVLAAVLTSLLVTVGRARDEAEYVRDEAEKQALEALSYQLSYKSRLRRDNPDLSRLLAIAAWEVRQLPETAYEIRSAFSDAQRLQHTFRASADSIASFKLSLDGRRAISTGGDSPPQIWDVPAQAPGRKLAPSALNDHLASISADGKIAATGGYGTDVRIWDTESGALLRTISGPWPSPGGISLTKDGGRLIIWGVMDSYVQLIDTLTGVRIRSFKEPKGEISEATLSTDERLLLASSADGATHIWSVATSDHLGALRHGTHVRLSSISSKKNRIVSVGSDGSALLWTWPQGKLVARLSSSGSLAATFSPDGKFLAIGTKGGATILFNSESGTIARSLSFLTEPITLVQFTPDGLFLATASNTGKVVIWEVSSGAARTTLAHSGPISSGMSPDSSKYLTAGSDGNIRIWRIDKLSPTTLPSQAVSTGAVKIHASGNFIIYGDDSGDLRTFNISTGAAHPTVAAHPNSAITSVDSTKDGRLVLTSGEDGSIGLWTFPELSSLNHISADCTEVSSATFSGDGSLALVLCDGKVLTWNSETGVMQTTSPASPTTIDLIVPSPVGRVFLTVDDHLGARLWDGVTGESYASLADHTDGVSTAVFDSSGERLLIAGLDSTLCAYDTSTGRRLWKTVVEGRVDSAEFSPDGSIIATTGETEPVRILSANSGEKLGDSFAHLAGAAHVAFSSDSRTLVTVGAVSIFAWDVATFQIIGRFYRAGDVAATWAALDPSASHLLVLDEYGELLLFDSWLGLSTNELAGRLKAGIGRGLTPEEREESGLPPLYGVATSNGGARP